MPFLADRIFGWIPIKIDESWGLRTIPIGTVLSICNSTLCKDCQHLFLDIRFTEDELSALYNNYRGEDYTRLREHYEPGYRERNRSLLQGIKYMSDVISFITPYSGIPVSVLDWGGDNGINTPFRGQAKICHIYDISSVELLNGAQRVNRKELSENGYSLVVCSNVLEHVPYPSDILLDIKKAMGQDSILYIELPFESIMQSGDTPDILLSKKRHWHEHINFFSKASINALLDNCGLEVLELRELQISSDTTVFQIACKLIDKYNGTQHH
jgi:hypothetical protein